MKLIKKIKKNKLVKNIILIAGGTASAQVLNAFFSPLITRIYSPEEYGILTAYVTITSLLALGAFKYEIGIVIAEDEEKAINVFALSVLVLFTYVLAITLGFILLGEEILKVFNVDSIKNYKYLVPIGILLLGLYQIIRQYAYRMKDFKTIARTTITQSLSGNIIKVTLGLLGFGVPGLIIGNIFKDSAGIYALSKPLRALDKKKINLINLNSIKRAAVRYRDFPLFNLPTHFLSNFSTKLPLLFLTFLYDPEIVGLFGLANTIVRLPMRLIGSSVGDVFYSEAAENGRENPRRLKKLSNSLMQKLIIIGIFPTLVLMFLGPQLFSIAFGNNWSEAGVYSSIMSVMVFFMLIFSPISRVYEVFEKQKVRLNIDILKTILVLLGFGICWYLQLSPHLTILVYSIVMSLIHFVIYIYAQKIINAEIEKRESFDQL